MSATTWFIIAIIGFSLSGIALVAAIFIFIKLNIPSVIGDLSGKTVARGIENIKETTASERQKQMNLNVGFDKKVPTIEQAPLNTNDIKMAHASKRLDKTDGYTGNKPLVPEQSQIQNNVTESGVTESFTENVTEVLMATNETAVLTPEMPAENATEILTDTDNATAILDEAVNTVYETEVLSQDTDWGGTAVLSEENLGEVKQDTVCEFKIVRSETRVHSDEVI